MNKCVIPDEQSYGAIPFFRKNDELFFLMVRQKHGGHWSFPKGHAESGETCEETMRRELYEETGIRTCTFVAGGIFSIQYDIADGQSKRHKIVSFQLCEVPNDTTLTLLPEEIIEAKWGTLDELRQLPLFPEMRTLLEDLHVHFHAKR